MTCERCGTCCRKGGPALHYADRDLVGAVLAYGDLMTLRMGEVARDPVQGNLGPLEQEVIMIKPGSPERTCRFFQDADASCAIYESRPAECQALDCHDTSGLQAMYARDRLTRGDFISKESALGLIVAEHEAECPGGRVATLAPKAASGDKDALRELLGLAEYDRSIRAALVAKAGADMADLDFILGRSVVAVIENHGLIATRNGPGAWSVRRISPKTYAV
jgi:Fe-S-cluster containining protein